LLIDADHQCAAGHILLGDSRFERCELHRSTLHDLLSEMVKKEFDVKTFAEYVVPVSSRHERAYAHNVSVMPCSLRIDDYQRNYYKAHAQFHSNDELQYVLTRRFRAFRTWLQANFDYTIIDCPPSLPIQAQMLVKVADAYIVPSVPDKLSVRGTYYLVDRLRRKNFKIPGLGMLWSLYREQNEIHREIIRLARQRYGLFARLPKPFDTVIPNRTAIVRAMEFRDGTLTARYSPACASIYRKLVDEIVIRCRFVVGRQRPKRVLCTVP
jgi:chromosome partitioning protein